MLIKHILEYQWLLRKTDLTLNTHWKDWCWRWSSSILVTWCEQPAHWKSPWCWERLRAEGEGGIKGWDGWMASPMQRTWTWANFGRWGGTRRPGVLQSTGSPRVRHDWVTQQQQFTQHKAMSIHKAKAMEGEITSHLHQWRDPLDKKLIREYKP